MELERSNTFKLINHNSRENFELNNNNDINNKEKNEFQESENISNQKSIISKREKIGYNDLKFDNRHTFIKISNVTFHYKTVNSNTKKISLLIDTCKIAWNKFNKDVLQIIIQDILLLLDSILKKKKNKNKKKKKKKKNYKKKNNKKKIKNNNKKYNQNSNIKNLKKKTKKNEKTNRSRWNNQA
jgi:hypothetical protein